MHSCYKQNQLTQNSTNPIKNQSGFSLIQVMVAAAIFSVLSLAIGNLLIEQRKAISYLEDQLEKVELIRNFETAIKNSESCRRTLQNVQVPSRRAGHVESLQDNLGNVIFESNSTNRNLNIGQMTIENESLAGSPATGLVKLTVPLTRTRSGIGSNAFQPLEFRINVTLNSSRAVISCDGNSTTDCIGNPVGGDTVYQNGDTWSGRILAHSAQDQYTGTPIYKCVKGSWVFVTTRAAGGP